MEEDRHVQVAATQPDDAAKGQHLFIHAIADRQEAPDKKSSLGSIIGGLTAIISICTAILYYTGYLFLMGYYSAFDIPVDQLNLSLAQFLTASGRLLLPLIPFVVFGALSFVGRREPPISWLKGAKLYLAVFAYILLLIFLLPPTGRWFAKKQIRNQWSAYRLLAPPLPSISIYTSQPIANLKNEVIDKKNAAMYANHNLRLLASTPDYIYLYSESSETHAVPQDKILSLKLYQGGK